MKNVLLVFMLFSFCLIHAQEKAIEGIITDSETGETVVGAAVVVKGTSNGTSTDFDGKFTIKTKTGSILTVTSLGYKPKEITVGTSNKITISLQPNVSVLNEIVVVGYGTQKKTDITSAVSNVKVDDVLKDRPITNVLEAVQGVVPGMQITSNSGEPGDLGLSVNIRGFTSINGGTPLFLLDNVEISPSDINPQDIASISVLKDVSATSIYGPRAAFGVVLLTSKKGRKNQDPKFRYTLTTSLSSPEDVPKQASTYNFIKALNDWGETSYWGGQDVPTWLNFLEDYKQNPEAYPDGYATDTNGLTYSLTDHDIWGTLFSDPAFSQIHNLSVHGGSEKITYRISGAFANQNGTIVTDNDNFKKYNINSDISVNLTDKLSTDTKLMYMRSNRSSSISSFSRSVNYPSFAPIDGYHEYADGTVLPYESSINRERLLPAPIRIQNNIRFFQQIKYEPIKDLNLTGEYTFERKTNDYYNTTLSITMAHPVSFSPILTSSLSSYERTNSFSNYNTLNLYADYTKKFNKHKFKGLIGYNKEIKKTESYFAKKEGIISNNLPSLSLANGTTTADDGFSEWAVLGYFGRLNYDYAGKYFLEGNIRRDASSIFPKKDKYSTFTSVSGGWIISKESFMNTLDFVSLLKLRASYGELGNQKAGNLGVYPSIEQFGSGTVNWIDPDTGLGAFYINNPTRLISPSFTWERVENTNFGVDLGLFNDNLTANFDIYTRNTKDMLTAGKELPSVLGADEPKENAGDLQTKGWEFQVNWKQNFTDFSYNIGVSLSDNTSKITKFENEEGLLSNYYVGETIGDIWGYVTDGYYTVDDFVEGTLASDLTGGTLKDGVVKIKNGSNPNPGDVKYKDLNGDGEISPGSSTLNDPGDRKVIGNNSRRYQYGVFGNVKYKNFDFSFLFNGVGKKDVWVNNAFVFPYRTQFESLFNHQLDYWTPENTDAYLPRIYPSGGGGNYGANRNVQTKYLLDGSYLRLKNITLGYSIPQEVLDKLKLDNVRLFIAAENLVNFDHLPNGINTELENKGAGATYPFSRTFSTGINIQF
ncbi:SusC/RagA family TonB-linked outer membrane protein [Tenacibaculum sp. UWU-22]|uniref:SusC/RagA family TonB-linked outer membrane protein n=1 Tax=Tenacibaculum sp. UWU-22 TaxID=3234187 RepID=UPI0034DB67F1